jgi:agmatinase
VGCVPSYHILAGTPEAGGWTTRELKRIIRGLAGLNFVYVLLLPVFFDRLLIKILKRGADIVEVAPAYDNGEQTRHHPLSGRSLDCSFS